MFEVDSVQYFFSFKQMNTLYSVNKVLHYISSFMFTLLRLIKESVFTLYTYDTKSRYATKCSFSSNVAMFIYF